MKTNIQAIHFKADQKLLTYIDKKLDKLDTFYDGIIDSTVFLKVANRADKDNKVVEIKINVLNQSLFKTQTASSFEAATDLAVEALKKQVKRYKETQLSVA